MPEMLARLRLPPTVHDESHFRLWNRRFHPFDVYSEAKRREKLNYMHNNPVKRGLVSSPGDWPVVKLEILLFAGRIRPAHGPPGLSLTKQRVPSGHRRPQKAEVCASRPFQTGWRTLRHLESGVVQGLRPSKPRSAESPSGETLRCFLCA